MDQMNKKLLDRMKTIACEIDLLLEQAGPGISPPCRDELAQMAVGLRLWLTAMEEGAPEASASSPGAIPDPHIARLLDLMHSRHQDPWTVTSLAEEAGMSRSTFASRFVALMRRTPMQYLLECRLQRACRLLRQTPDGLKQIARQVGYRSESSFSNAFKRQLGLSPGAYRGGAQPPMPTT
ncbi:MAG: helix-turn-helix transcriptional regulator [Planctomycetota bacterium]|nr:helix-turn-helix transcriptional regulator [Planctomycetota bacterium]